MVILIGTKGQLIKVASVMKELDKTGVSYKYVQTDQHPEINRKLEKQFGLKQPDLHLCHRSKDLSSPREIPLWFFKCLITAIKRKGFFEGEDILITQGDTLSTLLGCFVGKLFKLKIAHIEAGLRSFSILHPFPEELVRRITSKFSDILFAPSKWAAKNLRSESGNIINTDQNTVYDTLFSYLDSKKSTSSYVVAAIHRQETIYNPKRFRKAVEIVKKASTIRQVIYVLHKPSEKQLQKIGLYKSLEENSRIKLIGYQDYLTFMKLVNNSEFVITDGGGLQEETFFLDVPCLLLRNRTERKIGLGETACLSEFRDDMIEHFFKNYTSFHRKEEFTRKYPSKKIIKEIFKIRSELKTRQ
jgi:UDP-N-acetylglucosamine 2-epimerase (non-hydrolysing)